MPAFGPESLILLPGETAKPHGRADFRLAHAHTQTHIQTERVAAADLQIHPREVEALNLIRRIMMTPSDRTDAPMPPASVFEFFLFIAALAAIAIAGVMIIALGVNEPAHRTTTQKSATVSPHNVDNYLELFADGPGRGWYVLGEAQCDVNERTPAGASCEQRPTTSLPSRRTAN